MKPAATVTEKPAIQDLFQRLERMEADMDPGSHTGHSRWMIPYADLLTLLLGLFLVIFASQALPKTTAQPKPTAETQQVAQQTRAASTLKQLRAKLNMKGVEVRQQRGTGLVISVKDSILFTPGSADLSPQAKQTLDQVIHELRDSMGSDLHTIRVEGHTDNTPIKTARFPSNWELSTARATNIVRHLAESGQFPPDKLSAAGYAEFKPLDDNSTIEGKQKNRRVDIVVLRPGVTKPEPAGVAGTPANGSRVE